MHTHSLAIVVLASATLIPAQTPPVLSGPLVLDWRAPSQTTFIPAATVDSTFYDFLEFQVSGDPDVVGSYVLLGYRLTCSQAWFDAAPPPPWNDTTALGHHPPIGVKAAGANRIPAWDPTDMMPPCILPQSQLDAIFDAVSAGHASNPAVVNDTCQPILQQQNSPATRLIRGDYPHWNSATKDRWASVAMGFDGVQMTMPALLKLALLEQIQEVDPTMTATQVNAFTDSLFWRNHAAGNIYIDIQALQFWGDGIDASRIGFPSNDTDPPPGAAGTTLTVGTSNDRRYTWTGTSGGKPPYYIPMPWMNPIAKALAPWPNQGNSYAPGSPFYTEIIGLEHETTAVVEFNNNPNTRVECDMFPGSGLHGAGLMLPSWALSGWQFAIVGYYKGLDFTAVPPNFRDWGFIQ